MKTIAAVLVALVMGCTSSSSSPPMTSSPVMGGSVAVSSDPRGPDRAPMAPIDGRPLTGRTGLRFLVPQQQGAVLLDIDRGTTRPVAAVPVPTPSCCADHRRAFLGTLVLFTAESVTSGVRAAIYGCATGNAPSTNEVSQPRRAEPEARAHS